MLFAALALLLAAEPVLDPVRAELDKVASRIERLKVRQLAGEDVAPELERLLVEAQELAQRIERERGRRGAGAPPPPAAPGLPPEELKERADALRDEADRIAMQLRELDVRIDAARRERRVEAGLESLTQERSLFGDPGPTRASSTGPGAQQDAVGPPDVTIGPSAGGGAEETSQGTALQRIDRLRAERARLAARQAALEAEAVKLEAEARRTAGFR